MQLNDLVYFYVVIITFLILAIKNLYLYKKRYIDFTYNSMFLNSKDKFNNIVNFIGSVVILSSIELISNKLLARYLLLFILAVIVLVYDLTKIRNRQNSLNSLGNKIVFVLVNSFYMAMIILLVCHHTV